MGPQHVQLLDDPSISTGPGKEEAELEGPEEAVSSVSSQLDPTIINPACCP